MTNRNEQGGPKKHAIPYAQFIQILLATKDPRTQALIAYEYAFAFRAGELASNYIHKYKRFKAWSSTGPRIIDLSIKKEIGEITLNKPNFKQTKIRNSKTKALEDVKRFSVLLLESLEPQIYNIVLNWARTKKLNDPLFNIKERRIRQLIKQEFERQGYYQFSSHWLRQWRAWHIGEATGDPYAVQAVLGHADLRTSIFYVSKLTKSFRDIAARGLTFAQMLGEGVVEK